MVEQVEKLRTELQFVIFRNVEMLVDDEVEQLDARSDRGVPSKIPERSQLLRYKGAGIEPQFRCSEACTGRNRCRSERASFGCALRRIVACARNQIRSI